MTKRVYTYSGSGANFSALAPLSMAGTVMTDWPEWYSLLHVLSLDEQASQALSSYNATIWGSSGNMTINGTSTDLCTTTTTTVAKRGIGAGQEAGVNLTNPPYAIHNGSSIYDRCSALSSQAIFLQVLGPSLPTHSRRMRPTRVAMLSLTCTTCLDLWRRKRHILPSRACSRTNAPF